MFRTFDNQALILLNVLGSGALFPSLLAGHDPWPWGLVPLDRDALDAWIPGHPGPGVPRLWPVTLGTPGPQTQLALGFRASGP